MPQLGEVRKGTEIGYKRKYENYIWHACVNCGKERWVILRNGRPSSLGCRSCAHADPEYRQKMRQTMTGRRNRWKGGRTGKDGYIEIYLHPDDFFYPMAKKGGYVLEHRLVMAKSLGRNLQSWEIVHHKNHIRSDNRVENLQLVSDDRHKQITILENRIAYLEKRVILIEARNTLLEVQYKQNVEATWHSG